MIPGHVGQDAWPRWTRSASAAEDDAAARRLEHRDVDVGSTEDVLRATRACPVAGFDEHLVDRDPSDVVVPTWRPVARRMWLTSRVVVVFRWSR